MSLQFHQQRINTLDREIANLERQSADQTRTEAQCQRNIDNIGRSMQNCSPSSLQSKMNQIDTQQRAKQRAIDRRADIANQIARKRAERARISETLQRESEQENRRQQHEQENLMRNYENRISQLSAALSQAVTTRAVISNTFTEEDTAEYDVFISHASEDKDSFVRDFALELQKRGIKVWIDELAIGWGDSLRAKIDSGLKRSRFGIVVISRHYIKKGWTKYELDGLVGKEMICGKTILPIWHDISKKEVQDFSLTLAERKALTTGNMTASEIADELVKLLPLKHPANSNNLSTATTTAPSASGECANSRSDL